MRRYVPCGACGAYVPTTGCRHWRPQVRTTTPNVVSQAAERRARARAVEAVAEFRRMMRLNDT